MFVIDYWYVEWVLYRILIIMFRPIPSLLPAEGFQELVGLVYVLDVYIYQCFFFQGTPYSDLPLLRK